MSSYMPEKPALADEGYPHKAGVFRAASPLTICLLARPMGIRYRGLGYRAMTIESGAHTRLSEVSYCVVCPKYRRLVLRGNVGR